jgi:hypothetical protein
MKIRNVPGGSRDEDMPTPAVGRCGEGSGVGAGEGMAPRNWKVSVFGNALANEESESSLEAPSPAWWVRYWALATGNGVPLPMPPCASLIVARSS